MITAEHDAREARKAASADSGHRHVGHALAFLLEMLEGDLSTLSPEARADAIARGFAWGMVRAYKGLDPARVVARLRAAADWIEREAAPVSEQKARAA